MAETCKGMIEKRLSGLVLSIPGLALIVVGVLILIEPTVLVWLVAALSILMGIGMLMLANFVRRAGAWFRSAHDQA
jgi:uncharacterized membrane protein